MFFHLSSERVPSYPQCFHLEAGYVLNCDLGWKRVDQDGCAVVYKGYWEERWSEAEFVKELVRDPRPRLKGNFLALVENEDDQFVMTFSRDRTTPIFYNKDYVVITNLPKDAFEQLKYNEYIVVSPRRNSLSCPQFDPFTLWEGWPDRMDYSAVVDGLDRIMSKKMERLKDLAQNGPVKIFFSGGVDTLVLLAFLRAHEVPHELVLYEFFQYDHFTARNLEHIREFWAYHQMHHWSSRSYLVSGANGDESLMRNPRTGALNLIYRGVPVNELLDGRYSESYASRYLKRKKNQETLVELNNSVDKIQKMDQDFFFRDILIRNYLDFQHWHLGQTMTFTPYKDMDLIHLMMSADDEVLTEQFFNGQVNRDLVAKKDPQLLDKISRFKNCHSMENCIDFTEELISNP